LPPLPDLARARRAPGIDHGSKVDLLHLLFGSILAIDDTALILIGAIATLSLLALAVIYRPLVVECFDPGFLRAVGGRGALVHTLFLALVVLNLVAGFQALGTLMAVGLMMLPAAAARFWVRELWSLSAASSALALAAAFLGLLVSYHLLRFRVEVQGSTEPVRRVGQMHQGARDVTFFDGRVQVGFVAANDAIDEILEVCILRASLDRRLLLLIPV